MQGGGAPSTSTLASDIVRLHSGRLSEIFASVLLFNRRGRVRCATSGRRETRSPLATKKLIQVNGLLACGCALDRDVGADAGLIFCTKVQSPEQSQEVRATRPRVHDCSESEPCSRFYPVNAQRTNDKRETRARAPWGCDASRCAAKCDREPPCTGALRRDHALLHTHSSERRWQSCAQAVSPISGNDPRSWGRSWSSPGRPVDASNRHHSNRRHHPPLAAELRRWGCGRPLK